MARFALSTLALFAISSTQLAQAAPLFGGLFGSNAAPNATADLSAQTFDQLTNFVLFARASFCTPAVVQQWKCGAPCDAVPETVPLLAGGDDAQIPDFFVAFDPPSNSVVVAHQGTNPKSLLSILNDAKFGLTDANENRFPGAKDLGLQVHDGFQETFERTADQILVTVQDAIKSKGATNVKLTGHSLGAAVALLDTMHLRAKLDKSITMETVVFGLPRVGNQAFADFVDAADVSLQHVVNDQDIVPQVPPTFLGFRHPSGEVFQTGGKTISCNGQENSACSAGNNIIKAQVSEHNGPYLNVELGGKACPL